jgi:5'-deoxynucleotidase YfbR-like HD superfamily hydrolase
VSTVTGELPSKSELRRVIEEELNKFFNLENIKRYNSLDVVHEESVAEHTYMVGIISRYLCDIFGIRDRSKVLRILEMSLVHDVGEIYVGDILHSVKKMFPDIKKACKSAELKSLEFVFSKSSDDMKDYYKNLLVEFEEAETLESLVVRLADLISVYIYGMREEYIGNSFGRKLKDEVWEEIVEVYERLAEVVESGE